MNNAYPAEPSPSQRHGTTTTTCTKGWIWCIFNHDVEGDDYHAGALIDLDKAEADGGQYVAYLTVEESDTAPQILFVQDPGEFTAKLPLSVVDHLLDALDDGGKRAMQALAGLLLQGQRPPVRPWWETAANPPCPDWCTVDHPEGDFAATGVIFHERVLYRGETTTIKRVAIVDTEKSIPDTYETVYDEVEVHVDDDALQISNADGFAPRLEDLLPVAREVVRMSEEAL